MKYLFSILAISLLQLSLIFCKEELRNNSAFDDYKSFVCERPQLNYQFNTTEWAALEKTYQELKMNAETQIRDDFHEKNIEYASLQNDWNDFKTLYSSEIIRQKKEFEVSALESELLPPGITIDLLNVEAHNLKDIEMHFAQVVEAHKNELTTEQWQLIHSFSNMLNSKKHELLKNADVLANVSTKPQKTASDTVEATDQMVVANSAYKVSKLD